MPYKDPAKERARLKKWRADNPDKVKAIDAKNRANRKAKGLKRNPVQSRDAALKRKYGISLADYEAMHERQGGKCAICRRFPEKGKLLVVDHDHSNGVVRGLLCHHCNLVLGHGKDDVNILASAIQYLGGGHG